MTRLGQAATAALLCAAVFGLPAAPAQATAYRYWTYWHAAPGSSSWTFAGTGPTYRPSDGAVEGWRFAISQGTTSAPQPRADPADAFQRACTGVTAASGEKVVALVVDYGTASDEPAGDKPPGGVGAKCVHVAKNATGLDVLRAAGVAVRQQDGLVCGLNGYPKTECAVLVKSSPSPTKSASPSHSSSHSPSHSASHPSSPSVAPSHPTSAHSSPSAGGSSAAHVSSAATSHATPTPSATATSSRVVAAGATPGSPSATDPNTAATPSLVVGDLSSNAGHGRPWPLVGGIALLGALGAGAGLRARRRP